MKTSFFAFVFVLFCAVSLATDGQTRKTAESEKFPFKETQGKVTRTIGRSWTDFTVGGFKLQWHGSNGSVTFIGIQHFRFCVVPESRMKFEEITDPTQFLYKSLDTTNVIDSSSRLPNKRMARFPTTPQLPVEKGSTLLLKYQNKYLAFKPSGEKQDSLAYLARLWKNAGNKENSKEMEVTVDEATGIKTAKIAPLKEFFIPELGKGIVFAWDPKPRSELDPSQFPRKEVTVDESTGTKTTKIVTLEEAIERAAKENEHLRNYVSLIFTMYPKISGELRTLDRQNREIQRVVDVGGDPSSLLDEFWQKIESDTRFISYGGGIGTFRHPEKFGSPEERFKYKEVMFLRNKNGCVSIELVKVDEKEITFQWKPWPWPLEKTQVDQRETRSR